MLPHLELLRFILLLLVSVLELACHLMEGWRSGSDPWLRRLPAAVDVPSRIIDVDHGAAAGPGERNREGAGGDAVAPRLERYAQDVSTEHLQRYQRGFVDRQ